MQFWCKTHKQESTVTKVSAASGDYGQPLVKWTLECGCKRFGNRDLTDDKEVLEEQESE